MSSTLIVSKQATTINSLVTIINSENIPLASGTLSTSFYTDSTKTLTCPSATFLSSNQISMGTSIKISTSTNTYLGIIDIILSETTMVFKNGLGIDINSSNITNLQINQTAIGTGFFIQGPDNNYRYILTCAHCIFDHSNSIDADHPSNLNISENIFIFIHYPENKLIQSTLVEVVGYDLILDVALLRIPKVDNSVYPNQSSPTLSLGDSKDPNLVYRGAEVYSPIYNIELDTVLFVRGMILNTSTQFGDGSYPDCILTDLPLHPGNSGSPTLVAGNVVVGIASFLYPKNSIEYKYSSSISSRLIKYLVEEYFFSKLTSNFNYPLPITYPVQSLGFDYSLTGPLRNPNPYSNIQGAIVESTYDANQDLNVGDIIISIEDKPVKDNIFEILYKLGGGVSNMDLFHLSTPINSPCIIQGQVFRDNIYYNITISMRINRSSISSTITIEKPGSQSFNLIGNGIATASNIIISTTNPTIVNSGKIDFTLNIQKDNTIIKNFYISGSLSIVNSNFVGIFPLSSLKLCVQGFNGLIQNPILMGSLTSFTSPIIKKVNLQVYRSGNIIGIPTIRVDLEDNMSMRLPNHRQLLNKAQFISWFSAIFNFPTFPTFTFPTPTYGPFTVPTGKKLGDPDFQLSPPTTNMGGTWTFSSSNNNVATVSSTGLVHIIDGGSVEISVMNQITWYTARAILNIYREPILPTFGNWVLPHIALSTDFQLTPPNSNSSGNWTFSVPFNNTFTNATVSPTGLIKLHDAGTVIITATQSASGYYLEKSISARIISLTDKNTYGSLTGLYNSVLYMWSEIVSYDNIPESVITDLDDIGTFLIDDDPSKRIFWSIFKQEVIIYRAWLNTPVNERFPITFKSFDDNFLELINKYRDPIQIVVKNRIVIKHIKAVKPFFAKSIFQLLLAIIFKQSLDLNSYYELEDEVYREVVPVDGSNL